MTERANEKDRSLAALTPSADRSAGFTGAPNDDGAGARNSQLPNANSQGDLGVGSWALGVPPAPGAGTRRFVPATYLRGVAYLQLKDGHAAGVQFEGILSHRGEAPTSPLYPLAHLGVARAAALTGDVARARRSYEQLFSLWGGADSTLQPLNEARREYARLQ